MQNELDNICQKLIELAIGGNIQAIKLVFDRILPPKASRSVEIAIPKIENTKDALQAISNVIHAVGQAKGGNNKNHSIIYTNPSSIRIRSKTF